MNLLTFQFDCYDAVYLFLEDGTEIDDEEFFDSLQDHTMLLASKSVKFAPQPTNKGKFNIQCTVV